MLLIFVARIIENFSVSFYDDNKRLKMFGLRLDWCNILIGSFSFLIGCCLAAMSLKLDPSGMFAVLYMLLGTSGSIFIILLRQKKTDEAERVPLNNLKHKIKQNSEKSAIKCKVLAAELLNTTHSMANQKLDDTMSKNTGFGSPLSEVKDTKVFQEMNVAKIEPSSSIFQENVDNSKISHILKEDNPYILPSITIEDIEYDFELPELDESIWVNFNNQILPYDINDQYLDDYTTIDKCDENRYEDKLSSYKVFPDNIAKSPVKSLLHPKKTISDRTLNQFFRNKTILERKLSSEPSCISCLCVNLLPKAVESNTLKVPQQSLLKKAHW